MSSNLVSKIVWYHVGWYSILNMCYNIYFNRSSIWNCIASSSNSCFCSSSLDASFYWITAWSNCLCKLIVITWLIFFVSNFSFLIFFFFKFNPLWQLPCLNTFPKTNWSNISMRKHENIISSYITLRNNKKILQQYV
jgi:hypothetical protein